MTESSFVPGELRDDHAPRLRARDLGWITSGTPGPWNAITDVPGVEVGYRTLINGTGALEPGKGPVRTGVTAILPRGRSGIGRPVTAGMHVLNGAGEMTGAAWIHEAGQFNLPIVISNTHAIGACHSGTVRWINRRHPGLARQWLLPVCAETWDGYLNDINGEHVTAEDVIEALDTASSGPLAEGSVGGGTVMNCYAFKGGSGTSSRTIEFGSATYTLGAFVQANFGARHELTIRGRRLGAELDVPNPMEDTDWRKDRTSTPGGAGSIIVVIATDAPLTGHQCSALARRVPLGLARTGTTGSIFSGDIFLAFSTANDRPADTGFTAGDPTDGELVVATNIPWNRIDLLHTATVDAVEEAVLNALTAADTMTGRDGHISYALPIADVGDLLDRECRHGRPQ